MSETGAEPERRRMVLLGAGASVDAGVPASFDMTEALAKSVGLNEHQPDRRALNFVCGALMAHNAAEGTSPYAGLDVERVFAAVQLLADRRTLELTPFVASWHPAVDTWDRPHAPSSFDRNLASALGGATGGSFKAARLIQSLVRSTTGTGSGDTYKRLADAMVRRLRQLLDVDPARLTYLEPLVSRAQLDGGLTVATLNYDRSIEMVAERLGVPIDTAIAGWAESRRWHWPDTGLRLLKLHGSINWTWTSVEPGPGQLSHRIVEDDMAEDVSEQFYDPVVVFGQRGKLRAEGPFLSLLAEFEKHLAAHDELIVVGYSFRDDHINEAIRWWTLDDASRTITVIDPSFPEDRGLVLGDFRTQLLHSLNPRERLHGDGTPESRVTVIRETAAQAIPGMFPAASPH
jgi:hypothetical protein